jgi:hypothetical protein
MKLYLSRTKPFSFLKNLQTVLVHRIGTESIPSYLLELKKRIKACIFGYHSFLEKKLFLTNKLLTIMKWSNVSSVYSAISSDYWVFRSHPQRLLYFLCILRWFFNSSKIYPAVPEFTIRSRESLVIFEAILQFKIIYQIIN